MHRRFVDPFGLLDGDEVRDVVCRQDRGLLGVLDHLGDRVVLAFGHIVHVVADDEDVRVGGLEGLQVDDAVVPGVEGLCRFDGDVFGRDARAPDDGAGGDRDGLAELFIDEGFRRDVDDLCVHLQFHAHLGQDARAGGGELVREVRDAAGSRVDAEDLRVALGQLVLDAQHRDVLGQLAGQFDTGEAGTDDTEGEELFDLLFVGKFCCLFEAVVDLFLDGHGVVEGPEGESVLLRALDAEEVRLGTGGDDQVVVRVVVDVALDDLVLEVDVGDFIAEETDVGGVCERLCEVVLDAFGFSATGGGCVDLRPHGEVRVLVDEGDADVLQAGRPFLQALRAEDTGKACADDDDVFLLESLSHLCFLPSVFCE